MWDFASKASRRVKSTRSIFIFALVATAAIFLLAIANFSVSFASTDATWSTTSSIAYQGKALAGPAKENVVAGLKLESGSSAYTYLDATASTDNLYVIYFSPNADLGQTDTANFRIYTYKGNNTYTNPSKDKKISISGYSSASSASTSACSVDGGLGWIICPITNTIAKGMDEIFKQLIGFLNVRPVTTDTNGVLYRAWTYMRSFANVAFVIAFLILIYSQLTSIGLSNYSIKKMLPRLIIAALLVNLSYYICAVAVDLSNIIGNSLNDVMLNVRNGLVGSSGNSWEMSSNWQNISSFVLSGGAITAATAIGVGSALVDFGVAGSLFLLLPSLVAGLMAVLTAFLILAGRQALITILVIISPLAFAAYLLPNTEKWFEKWQSTFMTMLILFPAFSLVFGGAQLAGTAIIQNANTINMLILGMVVQVIPLFITPMLIKLSGSTLGKLAEFMNKPAKFATEKTRGFTNDRSQDIKARRLGSEAKIMQPLKHTAQSRETKRRQREGLRNARSSMAEARWKNDRRYNRVSNLSHEAEDLKATGDMRAERDYVSQKLSSDRLHTIDTRMRNAKAQLEDSKLKADNNYSLYETEAYGKTNDFKEQSPEMQKLIAKARSHAGSIAVQGSRSQSIKYVEQKEFAKALENSANVEMRNEAGASIIDPINGPLRAQANAANSIMKARAEVIASSGTIIKRMNLSDDEVVKLALGNEQRGLKATPEMQEAAINQIAGGGNIKAIIDLADNIDLSKESNEDFRRAFTNSLRGNSARPKMFGFGWMGQVDQGLKESFGKDGVDSLISDMVNAQKLDAKAIIEQDADFLERVSYVIENKPKLFNSNAVVHLKDQIKLVKTDSRYSGSIENRFKALNAIQELKIDDFSKD